MKIDGTHKQAQEQFTMAQQASATTRAEAQKAFRFARLGDQWPDAVRRLRQEESRPTLTINRLPAFIRQVVNDARQNNPGIKVSAVEDGDRETAEVYAGLIRQIERTSPAAVAYDTAIDHAVTGGYGFFRITTDYVSPDSFDMEVRIERVSNPHTVYWDPTSTRFDAADWGFGFITESLSESDFERRFPKAKQSSWGMADQGQTRDHKTGDDIAVCEYWDRQAKTRKILQVEVTVDTGRIRRVVREDQMQDLIDTGMLIPGLFEVRRERDAEYHEVTRYLLSGDDILEQDAWPGSRIPICPVWGDEVTIDGQRRFHGMVHDAQDSQSQFNFWRSASTELVTLAPRAPWLLPTGSIPNGEEHKWATANTRNWAYLRYNPVQGGYAPQRQHFAGVPAGALQESLNASDDMKSVIGIYDASLGARGNETSGRAITARQREGDTSNFHFIDNLNRAIEYGAGCIAEIIPSVYSGRETIRILGEDMEDKVVRLAQEHASPENGLFDLSAGRYDVSVRPGPSYATQREEARDVILEFIRSVPGAAMYMGDILFRKMDFEGADELADRAHKLMQSQLPPTPTAPPHGAGAAPPGASPPMLGGASTTPPQSG